MEEHLMPPRFLMRTYVRLKCAFHANCALYPCKLCTTHANVDVNPRFVLGTFERDLSTFRSTHCTLYTLELQLELQPHPEFRSHALTRVHMTLRYEIHRGIWYVYCSARVLVFTRCVN